MNGRITHENIDGSSVKKKIIHENNEGNIVACLYVKYNGNLHPDSWLCMNGWK